MECKELKEYKEHLTKIASYKIIIIDEVNYLNHSLEDEYSKLIDGEKKAIEKLLNNSSIEALNEINDYVKQTSQDINNNYNEYKNKTSGVKGALLKLFNPSAYKSTERIMNLYKAELNADLKLQLDIESKIDNKKFNLNNEKSTKSKNIQSEEKVELQN